MKIYLVPGQGADHRLFSKLHLSSKFELKYIKSETPAKGASMKDYAKQLSLQIDNSKPFILIGVSIGGMIATEINELLHPVKTIVISSAKHKEEIPGLYRAQKYFPVYKLIPGALSKIGAQILQPIFEPARNKEEEIFKQMLKDKEPVYMKRTIPMIVNWERTAFDPDIISIHGTKDNTLPIKNVKVDYTIMDGSHLMILTKADELSELLDELLEEYAID